MKFKDKIMLPWFRESEMSKRVEVISCREFLESYLEPLKYLNEHPPAEKSK